MDIRLIVLSTDVCLGDNDETRSKRNRSIRTDDDGKTDSTPDDTIDSTPEIHLSLAKDETQPSIVHTQSAVLPLLTQNSDPNVSDSKESKNCERHKNKSVKKGETLSKMKIVSADKPMDIDQGEKLILISVKLSKGSQPMIERFGKVIKSSEAIHVLSNELMDNKNIGSEDIIEEMGKKLKEIDKYHKLYETKNERKHISLCLLATKEDEETFRKNAQQLMNQIKEKTTYSKKDATISVDSFDTFRTDGGEILVARLHSRLLSDFQQLFKDSLKENNILNVTKLSLPKLHITLRNDPEGRFHVEEFMAKTKRKVNINFNINPTEMWITMQTARHSPYKEYFSINFLTQQAQKSILTNNNNKKITHATIDSLSSSKDSSTPESTVITEYTGNIFSALEPNHTSDSPNSIAHCVSKDQKMTTGISRQILTNFPKLTESMSEDLDVGDVSSYITEDHNVIFNLITKKKSNGKPTLSSLTTSLKSLLKEAIKLKVKTIAMPRIGSGHPFFLKHDKVKKIIEEIFRDSNVTIHIYTWDKSHKDLKNQEIVSNTIPVIQNDILALGKEEDDEDISDERTKHLLDSEEEISHISTKAVTGTITNNEYSSSDEDYDIMKQRNNTRDAIIQKIEASYSDEDSDTDLSPWEEVIPDFTDIKEFPPLC